MRLLPALVLASALAAQAPSLPRLAWLEGAWVGEADGVFQEETWSAPEHGNLQGMYRELKDGRVLVMELLSFSEEADGPWLTMRHFGPGLKPREETPLRWRVTEAAPGRARFVNEPGGATLDYVRDGDTMRVRLEIPRKEGSRVETFVFRRKQS